ncbi:2-oxo acid dehydrogenase subunit E2 [Zhihengliuella alba]|uniref:Dihydrolipoamide acetyltransferase component of pyruvate dehydrogenase complex n=1 Tax=Zhihengliuella alba TaxID=547018 RepID=A0ABP7DCH4_9MICC
MAVKTFLLPDLGEGLTEADLLGWHVAVGDTVVVDQSIAEVETAKSSVEVPCPFAGVVRELHGEPGQTLDVGKPLISVELAGSQPDGGTPDGAGASSGAGSPAGPGTEGAQPYLEEELAGVAAPSGEADPKRANAAAATEAPAEAEDSGSGNVLIGYGTPGGQGARRRTRLPKAYRGGDPRPLPAGPGHPSTTGSIPPVGVEVRGDAQAGGGGASAAEPGLAPRVINPIVRRLAREHRLDLASLAGTGPEGLILRTDVEAAIAGGSPAADSTDTSAAGTGAGASAAGAGEPGDGVVRDARTGLPIAARTPVKGVRKTIAQAMTRSRTEIPEATVWVDVDATALVELRASLKSTPGGAPGLLALIARFALAGLARFPELNARVERTQDERGQEAQELVQFDGVNLGFAAQTDRGLVVPSVEGAHHLSARQLDAELRRLTEVAREGKCTPAELTRGTFTLNNYGVFGVDGSAAIINYPEAAILGVGRIVDKPWVVDGQLAVRKVTELTLAFDHRVCDGGVAGGFLRYVADAIENPGTVLADL